MLTEPPKPTVRILDTTYSKSKFHPYKLNMIKCKINMSIILMIPQKLHASCKETLSGIFLQPKVCFEKVKFLKMLEN